MLKKITEQDLEQYGVVGAPDELKGAPADVKAVFDRLVKEVVAKVVNEIIEAHNGLDKDVNGRIDEVAEELKKISGVNADNLGANNIALDKTGEDTLAKAYGLTSLVPTVYEALAKLGPIGTGADELARLVERVDYLADPATFLAKETAALFGLGETAVPDDVLGAIGNGFSRIVSGTVTGSSAATNDNPNKITFPFYPKLVIVSNSKRKVHPNNNNGESMARNWFFWIDGVTEDHVWVKSSNYGTYYSRHFSVDEKTLSWWQDQPSDGTINGAVVGSYVAFG